MAAKKKGKRAAKKRAAATVKRPTAAARTRSKAKRAPVEDKEVARLRGLLELMREHELVELEVQADGSVRASKVGPAVTMAAAPAPAPAATAAAPAAAAAAPAGDAPDAVTDSGLVPFHSPMVGTFYRAASPEADDYVVEGDTVRADSTLCIVEAMKVFNEIKAEAAGTVVEILVENGEAVEFGQPLFMMRPAS